MSEFGCLLVKTLESGGRITCSECKTKWGTLAWQFILFAQFHKLYCLLVIDLKLLDSDSEINVIYEIWFASRNGVAYEKYIL